MQIKWPLRIKWWNLQVYVRLDFHFNEHYANKLEYFATHDMACRHHMFPIKQFKPNAILICVEHNPSGPYVIYLADVICSPITQLV